MDFKFSVREKPVDEEIIAALKEDHLPVVICGQGEVGSLVKRRLESCGIEDIFFCDKISSESSIMEREVDYKFESYNVVAGYLNAYLLDEDFSQLKNKHNVFFISEVHGHNNITELIDKSDWDKYQNEYRRVFDTLEDEKSKESFLYYLNAKINEDASKLKKVMETPQYFSGSFLRLGSEEVLVDCGAYIGDSIQDFIEVTKGEYKKIFAFEPDLVNITTLLNYIKNNHLHDVDVIACGAYNEVTQLRFNSSGILSSPSNDGEIIIATDTIDNIVGNSKVTYIKMDIEGSELRALEGAKKTILRDKPVLGISAYHKADDTFRIMDFFNELVDGYKFYFRCHKPLPIDAVLYAIPY